MTDPNAHTADGTDRRLRYGVMYNGGPLSAWQARCIRELTDSGTASLVLAIANDGPGVRRRAVRGIGDIRWKNLLFEGYQKAFGRCSATEPCDHRALFGGVPEIRCTPERRGRYSEYFSEPDLEAIAGHDLDFILRFGFGIIRGGIHDVPRYGVWSFHHDDERKVRGAPAAFWPIYNGDDRTGLILQRLNDRLDGGVILRRGMVETMDTSYIANRERAFLAGTGFPAEVCRDILAGNLEDVCAAPSATDAPVYTRPTNVQMLRFAGIVLRNRIRRRLPAGWVRGKTMSSAP